MSVRRQALDLVFAMCDGDNAREVVGELTTNLATAEAAIREEMVLKVAVLAERYATDLRWYVDTVLQLIHLAGDYVSDDVWHRVVQMVTGHKDLQQYAAETSFRALEAARVHETAVSVGGYILGACRASCAVHRRACLPARPRPRPRPLNPTPTSVQNIFLTP